MTLKEGRERGRSRQKSRWKRRERRRVPDSQNSSFPLENSIDRSEEETFSNMSVDGRERVVEEDDLGVVIDESSDGDSLFLTEGEGKNEMISDEDETGRVPEDSPS